MEQDSMATDDASKRRTSDGRGQDHDFHSAPPSQQNGPSPFSDGPELIRGNHC
jgi:hypothetical protein